MRIAYLRVAELRCQHAGLVSLELRDRLDRGRVELLGIPPEIDERIEVVPAVSARQPVSSSTVRRLSPPKSGRAVPGSDRQVGKPEAYEWTPDDAPATRDFRQQSLFQKRLVGAEGQLVAVVQLDGVRLIEGRQALVGVSIVSDSSRGRRRRWRDRSEASRSSRTRTRSGTSGPMRTAFPLEGRTRDSSIGRCGRRRQRPY